MEKQHFTYWIHSGQLSDYTFINPESKKTFILNCQSKENFIVTNGKKITIHLRGVLIPFEFFALEKDMKIEVRTPVIDAESGKEYILIKEILHPQTSLSYGGNCDGDRGRADIEIIGDIFVERKEEIKGWNI